MGVARRRILNLLCQRTGELHTIFVNLNRLRLECLAGHGEPRLQSNGVQVPRVAPCILRGLGSQLRRGLQGHYNLGQGVLHVTLEAGILGLGEIFTDGVILHLQIIER